jgi:hypothetical protein
MNRKVIVAVSVIVIAIIAVGATYVYSRYFGPQIVMQNNPDKYNCRQGNVLDGVQHKYKFFLQTHQELSEVRLQTDSYRACHILFHH